MKIWINGTGLAALALVMANSAPAHTPTQADQLAIARDSNSLSIMTYNVHGLPWPIASDRSADLAQIGAHLARLRQDGRAPDVVVVQEAFTQDAKAIARRSGYRYVRFGTAASAATGTGSTGASWWKGEGVGASLDSGLMLLSDQPITNIRRMAFSAGDCAGYDCLAAKGALVATVHTRDGQVIDVATAHLNSRTASGVGADRSRAAWSRQLRALAHFIRNRQASGVPLVLTGDFNVGHDDGRQAGFAATWRAGAPAAATRDALHALAARGTQMHGDLRYVLQRGRDWSLSFDGTRARIHPVSATVLFGRNADGHALSDHVGYAVTYRLVR